MLIEHSLRGIETAKRSSPTTSR